MFLLYINSLSFKINYHVFNFSIHYLFLNNPIGRGEMSILPESHFHETKPFNYSSPLSHKFCCSVTVNGADVYHLKW